MDCSPPGFPALHYLLEFVQNHVHWVSDATQPSHPLSSPSLPDLSLSQHQGLFQWGNSSHQVAISASASVLPMNIQDIQWIFIRWNWPLTFPTFFAILLLKSLKQQIKNILCVLVLSRLVMPDSATPWTVTCQAPLSMGILQARILERVAILDLPNPGIEPRSPALQTDSLPSKPPGKPKSILNVL